MAEPIDAVVLHTYGPCDQYPELEHCIESVFLFSTPQLAEAFMAQHMDQKPHRCTVNRPLDATTYLRGEGDG